MRGRDRAGVPFGMEIYSPAAGLSGLQRQAEVEGDDKTVTAWVDRQEQRDNPSPTYLEKDMGVDLEADKLTTTLSGHMNKLEAKLNEATDLIDKTFGDANVTVDDTVHHVRKISDAFAKLKATLGVKTNNPPPGDLPT